VEVDSECFLGMPSPKSFFIGGGGERARFFFIIFFARLKPVLASIFLAKFHGRFALLTKN